MLSLVSSLFQTKTGPDKVAAIRNGIADVERRKRVVAETIAKAKAESRAAGAAAVLRGEARAAIDRTALVDAEEHLDELTLAHEALTEALAVAEKEADEAEMHRLIAHGSALVATRQELHCQAWALVIAGACLLRRTRALEGPILPRAFADLVEKVAVDAAQPIAAVIASVQALGGDPNAIPGANLGIGGDRVNLPADAMGRIEKASAAIEVKTAKSVGYDAAAVERAAKESQERAAEKHRAEADAKASARAAWAAALPAWAEKTAAAGVTTANYGAALAAVDDMFRLGQPHNRLLDAISRYKSQRRAAGNTPSAHRDRRGLAVALGQPAPVEL